jgi:hypothetical protein
MVGFAEQAFKLSRPDKDGVSLKDKLEQIEKATGKRPSALNLPEPPQAGVHVWVWFQELCNGRGHSEVGPNPISWADLHAWSSLTQTVIRPWEIRLIFSIDAQWIKSTAVSQET